MNRRLLLVPVLLVLGLIATVAVGVLSRRSSAQIAPRPAQDFPKLLLFFEPDFQGPSLEVTGTLLDMPVITDENGVEFNWNDNVRSLIVASGTWRLCQNGRANTKLDDTPLGLLDIRTKEPADGWSSLLSATSTGPLQILNPALGGFGHDVSSIELVSENNLPEWLLPKR
jgi:hypothetical protein